MPFTPNPQSNARPGDYGTGVKTFDNQPPSRKADFDAYTIYENPCQS